MTAVPLTLAVVRYNHASNLKQRAMLVTPTGFTPDINLPMHDDAYVHVFIKDAYVQRADGALATRWSDFAALGLVAAVTHSLGSHEGVTHMAIGLPEDTDPKALPEPFQAMGLRNWFGRIDEFSLAMGMRAVQFIEWDRTHRFCGGCGTATILMEGERAKRCPACNSAVYPRISPAMMVLVTRGKELLLARGVNFPPGRYSALAGFLEAGESIEDAVHREVFEEVGLKVKNLQYFGSQSWPFPNSLMIAFTAEYDSGEITPDTKEIADAQWFSLDALPQLPPRFSISRALLNATVERMLNPD